MKNKTLKDWRLTIGKERKFVDKKPYSHNIVNISLHAISRKWGKSQANKAIDDFKLEKLGWRKVK